MLNISTYSIFNHGLLCLAMKHVSTRVALKNYHPKLEVFPQIMFSQYVRFWEVS